MSNSNGMKLPQSGLFLTTEQDPDGYMYCAIYRDGQRIYHGSLDDAKAFALGWVAARKHYTRCNDARST